MIDKVITAYSSFVAYLDVVEDQGDGTNEWLALDVIDDIVSAEMNDAESMNMIKTVIRVTRTWELDNDAIHERVKTRTWLAGN